jgi:hypothetical protein
LLEHCVVELGGMYAMEDTDSMAIVATQKGGLVPCAEGIEQMVDGRDAVKALSCLHIERTNSKTSDSATVSF